MAIDGVERSTERRRLLPLSAVELTQSELGPGYEVRELVLAKDGPLGVTIVNSQPSVDDDGTPDGASAAAVGAAPLLPPYLSRIAPGGIADRSGVLREGDLVCANAPALWHSHRNTVNRSTPRECCVRGRSAPSTASA